MIYDAVPFEKGEFPQLCWIARKWIKQDVMYTLHIYIQTYLRACGIWWYMTKYDDILWYMMIYYDIWWYMMTYDDIWRKQKQQHTFCIYIYIYYYIVWNNYKKYKILYMSEVYIYIMYVFVLPVEVLATFITSPRFPITFGKMSGSWSIPGIKIIGYPIEVVN